MNQDRLQQIETNLRSKRIDVRKATLDELATIDSELAVPILKLLATENDFGLRCLAMMGFRNHLTDDSFSYLMDVLEQEQDSSVLAEAANSIFDFREKAIAPLQDLFERCDHWLVRHTVVAVLVESDDLQVVFDIAKKALEDEESMTKEVGILALSRFLDTPLKDEVFAIFTELAVAENWRTRWRTAIALTPSSDPRAKKLLAQLRQDENHQVVAAALEQQ
ncbi:HEAT repeat-containing PBS lyase [Hyella patelloides LEGE 07179]|uniref:HEAT repeat-containing PBS lyase n=1 Tax=Hyella patelloides LEGE 07179 TaxID=945734 RepID=A0A563W449_9CYAN|nr:HEAT repeat domain-containing protein [Hyella patelloides]VEP18472.1 HEAT repeat-containing PBS lyase [Hyella patelloides LEGE 07179]